jgi:hypothetical protein
MGCRGLACTGNASDKEVVHEDFKAGPSLRQEKGMNVEGAGKKDRDWERRRDFTQTRIHGSKEKALVFGHDTPFCKRRRI